MKRITLLVLLMLFTFAPAQAAHSDWRWKTPKMKVKRVKPVCDSYQCHVVAKIRTRENLRAKIAHFNRLKLAEWHMWTKLYIPDCTWYGESGFGPKYSRKRYTMPNSSNSGAYGKFQFMPGTYRANAKYGDWSPLDQEIAVRREYWKHGIYPWQRCTG